MNRRALLGAFVAIILALVVAGPERASAQSVPNACCSFIITYSNLLPANCLPIPVKSSWGGVVRTDGVTANGDNFFNFANCPPAPNTFDWVSLDGGVTKVSFTGSGSFTLPCGTTVNFDVSRDMPSGCIHIRIHP